MSNVFLEPARISKTKGNYGPVKYIEMRAYDNTGTPKKPSKIDADLDRVSFNSKELDQIYASPTIKKIDMQLISYIMTHLGQNSDTIELNPVKLIGLYKKKRSTISESIKRLISFELIEKIPGRCKYQINPFLMFKGKRVEYFEAIDPALVKRVSVL